LGCARLQPGARAAQLAASGQRVYSRRSYDPHLWAEMVRVHRLYLRARSSSRTVRPPPSPPSPSLPLPSRTRSGFPPRSPSAAISPTAVTPHHRSFLAMRCSGSCPWHLFVATFGEVSASPCCCARGQILSVLDRSVLDMGVLLLRRLLEDQKFYHAL
jgi:hypothetical protein